MCTVYIQHRSLSQRLWWYLVKHEYWGVMSTLNTILAKSCNSEWSHSRSGSCAKSLGEAQGSLEQDDRPVLTLRLEEGCRSTSAPVSAFCAEWFRAARERTSRAGWAPASCRSPGSWTSTGFAGFRIGSPTDSPCPDSWSRTSRWCRTASYPQAAASTPASPSSSARLKRSHHFSTW